MPRKSKVESSPHFEEIVDLLLQGESGRTISAYLKKQYDEDIGFNAINVYRRKHINMEEKVIKELDKRLAEKIDEKVQQEADRIERVEKVTDERVKQQADLIENVGQSINSVVGATATQLQGLLDVSDDYPEAVRRMEEEADDPNSKTSWKDVASEKRNAKKVYLDYIKTQESNVEVNVENNLSILEDVFDEDIIEDALNDN